MNAGAAVHVTTITTAAFEPTRAERMQRVEVGLDRAQRDFASLRPGTPGSGDRAEALVGLLVALQREVRAIAVSPTADRA